MKLREAIAQQFGFDPAQSEFMDGHVQAKRLADAAEQGDLAAEDAMEYGTLSKQYCQDFFSAHFAEVGCTLRRVKSTFGACWPFAPLAHLESEGRPSIPHQEDFFLDEIDPPLDPSKRRAGEL